MTYRIRRLMCALLGHTQPRRIQSRFGGTFAWLTVCPRCRRILAAETGSRRERRRAHRDRWQH